MDSGILDYAYPLNTISRLFALAHFTSKRFSKLWVLYAFLFLLIIIILSVYQVHLEISDENNSKLSKCVSFLRIMTPTITRTSICTVYLVKSKIFVHFLNCLGKIETVIQESLHVPIPRKLFVKFQIMVIFSTVATVGVHTFFAFIISGLIPAILNCLVIVSYVCQAQFICCVLLLNHYIEVINEQLDRLHKTHDLLLENSAYSKVEMIVHFANSKSKVQPLKKKEGIINICKELLRVISVVKEDLNSFFSFPILLVIAENLLMTTFSLYMLIKSLPINVNSDDIILQSSYMYSVILNTVQIIYIAFPCATAHTKIQRTVDCVHKLLNDQRHKTGKSELVYMTKELLHVDVTYTACGFFTLNESLLTSVFAAISTQLVILLQFQMSSSSPQE